MQGRVRCTKSGCVALPSDEDLSPGTLDAGPDAPRVIVVGITHAQTCLVLPARLRAFKAAGFRVVLVSSPGALLDRIAMEEGIEALDIPIERGIAPFADAVSFFRLVCMLYRLRPAITEFSTPKAGLLGNLAAHLCGVPVRVYMLRGLRLETSTGLQRKLLLAAERIASWCAHHVIGNSRSLRDKTLELGIAPEWKLRLIGSGSSHGVDVFHFAPGPDNARAALKIGPDEPVIGFVGRLTRDKGVPELIDAYDRIRRDIPSARLLMVGWFDESDDALDQSLRRRIESHPGIVFTGYVADTAAYYRAMDVLVLPTWREGFPNVVLEASASGIPVVTTIATGSRDAVIPEVTGLLIPPGYPQAIAEAVGRLLRNPDERVHMGKAGRLWVIERFVEEQVLRRTVDFYRSLLESAAAEDIAVPATDAAAVGD